MFEVAARSNDGRGIELSFGCDTAADGGSVLDARAAVDVLDSALIRFGMRIAADRVIPDSDQRADLRKLINAYRDALALDVQRFSRYGAHELVRQ
jgi:hypothetical protein